MFAGAAPERHCLSSGSGKNSGSNLSTFIVANNQSGGCLQIQVLQFAGLLGSGNRSISMIQDCDRFEYSEQLNTVATEFDLYCGRGKISDIISSIQVGLHFLRLGFLFLPRQ